MRTPYRKVLASFIAHPCTRACIITQLPEEGYTQQSHLKVAIEVHRRTKRVHGLLTMRTLRGREADVVSSLQALKDECIHA